MTRKTLRIIYTQVFTQLFALAFACSNAGAVSPSIELGRELYSLVGANSCLHCHGADGSGGKVAAAAKLNDPKEWKTYKALGGDAVRKANPKDFDAKLDAALRNLLLKGAVAHNIGYKAPGYDPKKMGGPLNAQMLGLTGAPSKMWVTKKKAEGVTAEIAADSVIQFVKTLDKTGTFK